MEKRDARRALVIGGSMSGLFAGILLRQAGWEAHIYERVAVPLSGRGAGIVTHEELWAIMDSVGIDPTKDLGVEVTLRQVLDRSGQVVASRECRQVLTSWDRLYSMLREVFPSGHYHVGKELIEAQDRGGSIAASFADGASVEAQLLVAADGLRSTVRGQVLPAVRPVYAGYVAWRGLVAEDALSERTHRQVFDPLSFCLPPSEQFLGYPVAGPDNDLRCGHRRYNWVWYRPAEEVSELQRLLTDASGHRHAMSIPPPLVRAEVVAELRAAAHRLMPPALVEVIDLTPQPFLQPIYDVDTTAMASGRVALIGDAAFLARPHVGAGVTKAAQDAAALISALQSCADIPAALSEFERARIDINRNITRHGRELGGYLRTNLTPTQRTEAERHQQPDAILAEIAMPDFLRRR